MAVLGSVNLTTCEAHHVNPGFPCQSQVAFNQSIFYADLLIMASVSKKALCLQEHTNSIHIDFVGCVSLCM